MPREYYSVSYTGDADSLRREVNRILDSISRRLNSIAQDGENISLGSKKITSLAAGTAASDGIRLDQGFLLADLASRLLGTADEITITDNADETLTFSLPSAIKLDGATASRLLATDASKLTASVDLIDWVAGTANQIVVTDDADGSVTLDFPDAVAITTSLTVPLMQGAGGTGNNFRINSNSNNDGHIEIGANNYFDESTDILHLVDDLIIGDGKTIGTTTTPAALTLSSTGSLFVTSTRVGTDEGSYNYILGTPIFSAKSGYTYNTVVGYNIANSATGNVYYNSITGYNIANSATGDVYQNSITGNSIANSATGSVNRNSITGTNIANSGVTGDVKYTFSTGYRNAEDISGETGLSRVIALPFESLYQSTASDLTDAIAIGYRAGYQNAYDSPALFGRQATATANDQAVIGSSFYTGGILLDSNTHINSQSTTTPGQIIQGAASQTADMLQIQDSSSNIHHSFSLPGATDPNTYINKQLGDSDTIIAGDTEANLFRVDAGADVVRIGDWDTNYTQFTKAGYQTMVGTARVVDHVAMTVQDLGIGNTPPSSVFVGNYSGMAFTVGDDSIVTLKPTHEIDDTEDIEIHVTWAINEAYATNSGEIQWQLEWSLTPAAGGEALDAPTHSGTVVTGDINIPATAKHLVHTTSLVIAAANYTYDDVLGIKLSRIAIDDGNNPTAEPVIVEWHLEYVKNKLGTALP